MYIRHLHKIFALSVFDTVQVCMYVQYIEGVFQSRLGTADYALVTAESPLLFAESLSELRGQRLYFGESSMFQRNMTPSSRPNRKQKT
jgi:hypothetical protein